jgi:hypothetical protein
VHPPLSAIVLVAIRPTAIVVPDHTVQVLQAIPTVVQEIQLLEKLDVLGLAINTGEVKAKLEVDTRIKLGNLLGVGSEVGSSRYAGGDDVAIVDVR